VYSKYAKHLRREEKQAFPKLLEQYAAGELLLNSVLRAVLVWGVRYDRAYFRTQSFFNPFPDGLLDC
jgi:uncharacterized protein YbgA (DUF1722 family)